MRLCLGGAVWGSLLGTLFGSLLGGVYGAFNGDVALGLDGAVLGCLTLSLLGGLYGGALAIWTPHSPSPRSVEMKPDSSALADRLEARG
jgi:predicted lipid-binding transport protein (Tim44 family)